MSLLELIALISGVLGVWLTIQQSIWCWPIALISVVLSFLAFYQQRLFGDSALQIFYFVAGIYGWYFWKRNSEVLFVVTKLDSKKTPFYILITILQSLIYYFLLRYFKSDQAMFDAILTACSLTATYMMTKKWLENWLIWVFIDSAYVILYIIKDMFLFAVLYAAFAAFAYYGWKKWKQSLA
ncbi:MAG: nicotinamide riboside transporter PnuC [Bacteroidota bacterium]